MSEPIKILSDFISAQRKCQCASAKIFREARSRMKLSQVEMAERLQITNVYLSYIENSKRDNPSAELLERLWNLLVMANPTKVK